MGKYNIPREFRKENRWFKIFKPKAVAYTGVATTVAFFIASKLIDIGRPIFAMISFASIVLPVFYFSNYSYPVSSKYSGGEDYDVVFIRKAKKIIMRILKINYIYVTEAKYRREDL